MELIRDFNKINKNDVAIAGGKGASLGEMTQAGIPVPNGFVILSNSFESLTYISSLFIVYFFAIYNRSLFIVFECLILKPYSRSTLT